MTFEAYLRNIEAKTGKKPRDFFEQAVADGVLRPDTKTMEFVKWLKGSSGLGHGHAMAVWESFRRSGWIPLPGHEPPLTSGTVNQPRRQAKK